VLVGAREGVFVGSRVGVKDGIDVAVGGDWICIVNLAKILSVVPL
jgi:hypothetical protein